MAENIIARKITSLPELVAPNSISLDGETNIELDHDKYDLRQWIHGLYMLLAFNDKENKKKNFKLKLNDLINIYIRNFIETEFINEINDKLDKFNESNYATKDDIERLSNLIAKYHPDGTVYNILYIVDENIRIISWKNTIAENEIVRIIYEIKSDNYKLDEENMSITNVGSYELDKQTKTITISRPYNHVTVTLKSKQLNSFFAVFFTDTQLSNIFGNMDFSDKSWVLSINNNVYNTINNPDYKYFTDEMFNTFNSGNPILRNATNNGYYTIIISKKYIDLDNSTLFASEGSYEYMNLIFKDSIGNRYELFSSDASMFGNPNSNVHIDFERPYAEFTYNMFKDINNNYPEIDNSFVIIRFNTEAYSNLYFYKL